MSSVEQEEHLNIVEDICESTLTMAYQLGKLFFNDGEPIVPSRFFILLTVSRAGSCTISAIAEEVGLSPGANTIAVNKLVKEGLLMRVKDKQDKRVCWMRITPAGQAALDAMIDKRNHVFRMVLADFPESHLHMFLQSLEFIQHKLSPSGEPVELPAFPSDGRSR